MANGGWPDDWDARKAGDACPMCPPVPADSSDDLLTGWRLPSSVVRLEGRSKLPGYCVVAWSGRHVCEPYELSAEDAAAYWADVTFVAKAIDAAFSPMKINLMTLGNWVPHLHTHVVPRYLGDPAPGGPIAYEAMLNEQPAEPDQLRHWADAIQSHLTGR